jgi:hypothetical protein
MDTIKTIKFSDGRQLEIIRDEDPESPREWDNLGTMVCFHQRYNLGDKNHGIDHKEFGGWDEMEKWIRHQNPDCVILPLYLFDHSGITISTGCEHFRACDGAGWDWGQVGFIFISREKINQEYGKHGGRTDDQIREYLRNEVKVYDQYLQGDIYGFIMREPACPTCDGPGEEGDSCWGFYGDDPLENGMIDHLDSKYREELTWWIVLRW